MAYIQRETFEILDADKVIIQIPFVAKHFWVDDLIALPIHMLNRKGYTTEGCCSGHLFFGTDIYEKPKDLMSYINFEEGISLPSLPPGFAWHNNTCIMYKYNIPYKYDANAIYGLLRENLDVMEQLYKWALKLPDLS